MVTSLSITKTQGTIIGIVIILIIGVLLFPFYWEGEFGPDKQLVQIHLKWGINPSLFDEFERPDTISLGGHPGIRLRAAGIREYPIRRDIQGLLIFVILLFGTVGVIVTKKVDHRIGNETRKMQKTVVFSLALLITFSVLFPPCNKFVFHSDNNEMIKVGTGWVCLFQTKGRELSWAYALSHLDSEFIEIRYPFLAAEIMSMLCLAGGILLVFARRKKITLIRPRSEGGASDEMGRKN